MDLGSLVEHFVTVVNGQDTSYWGNIKVPADIQAQAKLDPDEIYECKTRSIYIQPVVSAFNINDSNKRGARIQALTVDDMLTVSILVPFSTFGKKDVAGWSEVKDVLDLREKLETLVLTNIPAGYALAEFNQEPPIEINLKERTFLTTTEVVLRRQKC